MRSIPFRFWQSLTLTGLMLSPLVVSADALETLPSRGNDFSYSWVQGGLEVGDIENPRSNVDMLFVDGAWALDEHVFLRGAVSFYDGRVRGRPPRPDVDGSRLSLGAGFNTPLQEDLDLVVSGDLIRVRANFDGDGSDSETGFDMRGGVRYRATPQVEVSGGAFVEAIDRNELGVYGEGVYALDAPVNLGARLELGSNIATFGLFVRHDF